MFEKFINVDDVEHLEIRLLSPERVREISSGEILNSGTINMKNSEYPIIQDGLMSEKIFGPVQDYTCNCKKPKQSNNVITQQIGQVCKVCGVPIVSKKDRGYRLGHITLKYPLVHPYYATKTNHVIADILELSKPSNKATKKGTEETQETEDTQKVSNKVAEVINAQAYMCIKDIETYKKGQIYNISSVERLKSRNPLMNIRDYFETGGKAIRLMLQEYSYERYDFAKDEILEDLDKECDCSKCEEYNKKYRTGYKIVNIDNTPLWKQSESLILKYLREKDFRNDETEERNIAEVYNKVKTQLRVLPSLEDRLNQYVRELVKQVKSEQCYRCKDCPKLKAIGINTDEMPNNLEKKCQEYQHKVETATSKISKAENIRLLRIYSALNKTHQKPENMVLVELPVLPAGLRPTTLLERDKKLGESDITILYQSLMQKNNLYNDYDVNVTEEVRMKQIEQMQISLNQLIRNEDCEYKKTSRKRELKSVGMVLKGKRGLFRANLLGKRVDYSGRSVIVVGPSLKIYQCGLPKPMALELFKPFLIQKLVEKGISKDVRAARNFIEKAVNIDVRATRTIIENEKNQGTQTLKHSIEDIDKASKLWDTLEEIMKGKCVLLNRAPTLHRLSIQAFEPILVEGNAIKLHPVICGGFNADFDGDQMAVHLPLGDKAQEEAHKLMLSSVNLLKPATGEAIAVPTQDMILGSYYLTMEDVSTDKNAPIKAYSSLDELELAYFNKLVKLQTRVKIRLNGVILETTLGRIKYNECIPQNLGFVDRVKNPNALEINFKVSKKELTQMVERCIQKNGMQVTSEMLDKIKAIGFKYSTQSGLTIAVCDAVIPSTKEDKIKNAEERVTNIERLYQLGYSTPQEKRKAVITEWNQVTEDVTKDLQEGLTADNPIFIFADSGARGSINQIKQLAGMRGLISNTKGETLESPIKSNYREGLTVLEYFLSSRGARKGMVDTALRTADAGYFTRTLVDATHGAMITEYDCGTKEGVYVEDIIDGMTLIEGLEERIIGRFLSEEIEIDGEIIDTEHTITQSEAEKIVKAGYTKVKIRSILKCACKKGICIKCYGKDLGRNEDVRKNTAVGVIASQSVGEPGTQLTMRTFHTGGIASAEDITQGLPRVKQIFDLTDKKSQGLSTTALHTQIDGVITYERDAMGVESVIVSNDFEKVTYKLTPVLKPLLKEGSKVTKGDVITTGTADIRKILALKGINAVEKYILEEVQKIYRNQGVDINDKHIEVIIRTMLQFVEIVQSDDYNYVIGNLYLKREIDEVNQGKRSRGEKELEYRQVITGIKSTASNAKSFLSAVSFEKVESIIRKRLIEGISDDFTDMKEQVMAGKLIAKIED